MRKLDPEERARRRRAQNHAYNTSPKGRLVKARYKRSEKGQIANGHYESSAKAVIRQLRQHSQRIGDA